MMCVFTLLILIDYVEELYPFTVSPMIGVETGDIRVLMDYTKKQCIQYFRYLARFRHYFHQYQTVFTTRLIGTQIFSVPGEIAPYT
jgi:hypothetical protein